MIDIVIFFGLVDFFSIYLVYGLVLDPFSDFIIDN